jgi:hypothetical protein
MTEYHDRLVEADLSSQIDAAEELLGALSEDQAATLEQEKAHQVPRLRALLLALRPRVDAADPLLITDDVLARTRDPLTTVTNGLRAFMDDGNIEHLNGVRDWTETLAGVIALWPSPPDLPSTDASEVAARFRRSAGQQLRGLSADFEKVKENLTAFQQDLEDRTGQWGEQKTSLETQLDELTQTIEQQRGRLDQAIEGYQGQFSEAQERRNEEYRQQLSALEARSTELEKEFKGGFDETIKTSQEKVKETLEDLQGELVKAQEITSFVGGTSTAAGYGKEAKSQKSTADWLRGLAIFFGLLAAGLAVWAILHAEKESNPSLTVVLSKAV